MEDKHLYFHFTLGPVQAFVAQARRTRDFWAGSFLLSWLSSVAMKEVQEQGGKVEFPLPDKDYLKYLSGEATNREQAPRQGSIPNRFKALQAKVPADFDPEKVTKAVQQAWWELAELIWQKDFHGTDLNSESRNIWQRQIKGFWDISWVLTENKEASNLLDRRKNWRSYMAPEEPGVSCMMMDGWQELSGMKWPGQELNNFWKDLRKRNLTGLKTDLREQEYLCAIGWIKRRFARYFEGLKDIDMGRWTLNGWPVPINVPSVNYLASAPWLAKSIIEAGKDHDLQLKLRNLENSIACMEGNREGQSVNLKRVVDACSESGLHNWQWQQVNGRYLYQDEVGLMAERSEDSDERAQAKILLRQLQGVQSQQYKLGQPSDFYSILLMDGDSLGSQMSDASKQEPISAALNNFTSKVPAVVQQYSGFLVYAGGDDVLALLSVDDSLACANALRKLYNDCFAEQNRILKEKAKTKPELVSVNVTSSLSGALMYCHYKSPLARNLAKAHPLLDNIAKDECGRDSLAIQVWKPGGQYCSWSSPWDVGDGKVSRVNEINQLVTTLIHERQNDDRIARKFFFKLDELIQTLGLDKKWLDEDRGEKGIDATRIESLFRAAWLHTGNSIQNLPVELPGQLLAITRTWQRKYDSESDSFKTVDCHCFSADALKLIHFLATELQQPPKDYLPEQPAEQPAADSMEQAR
jgi:CRISPR-associated protein Cmr2